MTNISLNGGKWHGDQPQDIQVLLELLKRQPLHPRMEALYGKPFITPVMEEDAPTGVVRFWGNFYEVEHAFDLRTDESALILLLTDLITKNMNSEKYKSIKGHR